jgi:cytochrome P450
MAAEYGDAYRVRIWSRQFVVMGDPQVAAEGAARPPRHLQPHRAGSSTATEMGFGGLFASNGEKWRRQRPMVMAPSTPGHIKRYLPALLQVAQRLSGRWERAGAAGEVIDVQGDLMRYTVDVIAGLAFGADINTLEGDEDVIQHHMDKIFPRCSAARWRRSPTGATSSCRRTARSMRTWTPSAAPCRASSPRARTHGSQPVPARGARQPDRGDDRLARPAGQRADRRGRRRQRRDHAAGGRGHDGQHAGLDAVAAGAPSAGAASAPPPKCAARWAKTAW